MIIDSTTGKTVFTLLGTGSSGGVPRIGNDWGNCDPDNNRNRRRRCAMLIEQQTECGVTTVLIDTGPDMREQLLDSKVSHLDAALLTHSHADHIFGLDDLRQLAIRHRERINVFMDSATSERVMLPFGYCFTQAAGSSYPAICREHRIEAHQKFTINGTGGALEFLPFDVDHGDISALGFRIGNLAYLPDVKYVVSDRSRDATRDLEILIIDALRYSHHPTHMNVDEALTYIDDVAPKRAILTNMHSSLDYQTLCNELPANVTPAYDGMTIEMAS